MKIVKLLGTITLSLTLLFTTITPIQALANNTTLSTSHRIAGYTQYDTSAQIAKQGWPNGSKWAIIVNGENFADALVAAPLAKKVNAPILLTGKDSLPSTIKQTVKDLGITDYFIVGGYSAVSKNIQIEMNSLGAMIKFRLSGNDMYETSSMVAQQFLGVSEIILATGNDYSDALSIASYAASKQIPILLVDKDSVDSHIFSYFVNRLKNLKTTYVIGGTGVISENVANQFPNPIRISGNDKYDTNLAVLKMFNDDFNFENVFVATGNGFADALSGSVYAASQSAPILLVDKNYDSRVAKYLNSKGNIIKNFNVLGGEAVVSTSLVQNYTNQLNMNPVTTPLSTSNTALSPHRNI